MGFESVTMVIDGHPVEIDLDGELAIGELTEDMTVVAAKMAYWGAVWAAAESERERAEAHYKHWRADQTQMILDANDKMAEWKVRAEIESSAAYLEIKEKLALSVRNAILSKSIVDAFRVKASLLQSRGAMLRAEFEGTAMSTKSSVSSESTRSPRARANAEKRVERESAVRDIFKKKQRNKKRN